MQVTLKVLLFSSSSSPEPHHEGNDSILSRSSTVRSGVILDFDCHSKFIFNQPSKTIHSKCCTPQYTFPEIENYEDIYYSRCHCFSIYFVQSTRLEVLLFAPHHRRYNGDANSSSGYKELVQAHPSAIMDTSKLCLCSGVDSSLWSHGCICVQNCQCRIGGLQGIESMEGSLCTKPVVGASIFRLSIS